MTDSKAEKHALRALIAARKTTLAPDQMLAESQQVFHAIEATEDFKHASRILLYYSLADELPTHDVVERWSGFKQIFLPRVEGDHIVIVPYCHQLSTDNRYHIAEPVGAACDQVMDLALIPAVAVAPDGFRLGRGGGFYDRWLALGRCNTAWAVALDCQLVASVPVDSHDVRLDGVVTATHAFFNLNDCSSL